MVTTFCVVNVPFLGQQFPSPYVAASVLIDGADIAFQHLILGCPPRGTDGHAGQGGLEAAGGVGTSTQNIDHFEPTGEPDAPYESYAHHL